MWKCVICETKNSDADAKCVVCRCSAGFKPTEAEPPHKAPKTEWKGRFEPLEPPKTATAAAGRVPAHKGKGLWRKIGICLIALLAIGVAYWIFGRVEGSGLFGS